MTEPVRPTDPEPLRSLGRLFLAGFVAIQLYWEVQKWIPAAFPEWSVLGIAAGLAILAVAAVLSATDPPVTDPTTPGPLGGGHPELSCGRCAGPNVTWTAPSPLWNQVMRDGDINGPERFGGIVCPTCFAVLAREAGVATYFRLFAPEPLVPLATTTPSGRVWDPARWLWVEPQNARLATAGDDTR